MKFNGLKIESVNLVTNMRRNSLSTSIKYNKRKETGFTYRWHTVLSQHFNIILT